MEARQVKVDRFDNACSHDACPGDEQQAQKELFHYRTFLQGQVVMLFTRRDCVNPRTVTYQVFLFFASQLGEVYRNRLSLSATSCQVRCPLRSDEKGRRRGTPPRLSKPGHTPPGLCRYAGPESDIVIILQYANVTLGRETFSGIRALPPVPCSALPQQRSRQVETEVS